MSPEAHQIRRTLGSEEESFEMILLGEPQEILTKGSNAIVETFQRITVDFFEALPETDQNLSNWIEVLYFTNSGGYYVKRIPNKAEILTQQNPWNQDNQNESFSSNVLPLLQK